MQFINIVVHSVENMNFRVHLQYEFTHLGLDKYLAVSVNHEKLEKQMLRVDLQTQRLTLKHNGAFRPGLLPPTKLRQLISDEPLPGKNYSPDQRLTVS